MNRFALYSCILNGLSLMCLNYAICYFIGTSKLVAEVNIISISKFKVLLHIVNFSYENFNNEHNLDTNAV